MGFTSEEKKDIACLVADLVTPYLKSCQCDLSPETAKEMGHLMGRFKDLGDGNLSVGIEETSAAIQWVIRIKQRGEKIGGAVAVCIALTLTTGLLGLIWAGFRAAVVTIKGTAP